VGQGKSFFKIKIRINFLNCFWICPLRVIINILKPSGLVLPKKIAKQRLNRKFAKFLNQGALQLKETLEKQIQTKKYPIQTC
jgi:hypothetical protein